MRFREHVYGVGLWLAVALATAATVLLEPVALSAAGTPLSADDLLSALAAVQTAWFLFVWPAIVLAAGGPRPFLPLAGQAAASAALTLPLMVQGAALGGGGLAEALAAQVVPLAAAASSAAALDLSAAVDRRWPVRAWLAAAFALLAGGPLLELLALEIGQLPPGAPAPSPLWFAAVAVAVLAAAAIARRRRPRAAPALALFLLAGPAMAAEIESVRFASDCFRPGEWTQVEVVVSHGPFEGSVEIEPSPGHRYRAEVSLHDDAGRVAVLLECLLDGRHARAPVRLVEGDRTLAERAVDLPARSVRPAQVLVGVHPAGRVGDDLQPISGRAVRIANLAFVPEHPGLLSGVDVLVLAAETEAGPAGGLIDWVRAGGRLVLADPRLVVSGAWQAVLFPRGIDPPRGPADYPIADALARSGIPEEDWLDWMGEPVGAAIALGRGRVAVLDSLEPLPAALRKLAAALPAHPDRTLGEEVYQAAARAGWSSELRQGTLAWIAGYLAIAALLAASPRAFPRALGRSVAPAALAAAAVAGAAGAWLAGSGRPASTVAVGTARPVLALSADGRSGELLVHLCISARRRCELAIGAEPGARLYPVAFDAEHWHRTPLVGSPDRVGGIVVEAGHRFGAVIAGDFELPGPARAVRSGTSVRIENGTGRTWRATVYRDRRGGIVDVGALPDGEAVSIDLATSRPASPDPGRPGPFQAADLALLSRAAGAGEAVLAILDAPVGSLARVEATDLQTLPAVLILRVAQPPKPKPLD